MIDFTEELTSNKTFSYDPSQITDKGINQMRFELGDTDVSKSVLHEAAHHGFISSLMCDEEYQALIESNKNWKKAKIACLTHILMQMAYDVDKFTIDGLSLDWSGRYKRFQDMLKSLKTEDDLPSINPKTMGRDGKGRHYFYDGMLRNPRKFGA